MTIMVNTNILDCKFMWLLPYSKPSNTFSIGLVSLALQTSLLEMSLVTILDWGVMS